MLDPHGMTEAHVFTSTASESPGQELRGLKSGVSPPGWMVGKWGRRCGEVDLNPTTLHNLGRKSRQETRYP